MAGGDSIGSRGRAEPSVKPMVLKVKKNMAHQEPSYTQMWASLEQPSLSNGSLKH